MRVEMKRRREELGLTQAEMAQRIGVARSTYTNIELGEKNPSFASMLRIKSVLDVIGDEIFIKRDVPESNKIQEYSYKDDQE